MGSSRVSFRNKHFEARDPVLEVWLRLIVDEIDALAEAPDWLRTTREDWQLMATEEFGFGVVPDLDRVAAVDERRKTVLELSERALERLKTFGDPIPKETLNALGAGKPGEGFPRDLDAKIFLEPAQAFVELLK